MKLLDREKWARIQGLQKGTHLISLIHKPVEDIIVYLLYDHEWIGADHISLLTYGLAAITAWLFARGSIARGLLLAILVGILDGVDGKIARLRGKSTLIGKLEHSFDMLYEQCWYAALIWWIWSSTGERLYLALGLAWLLFDSLVRHVYNVVWVYTGKSLKRHPGVARIVTKVDGRRSVYILHLLFWYLVGRPFLSLWTILAHCSATAIAYIAIGFTLFRRAGLTPS